MPRRERRSTSHAAHFFAARVAALATTATLAAALAACAERPPVIVPMPAAADAAHPGAMTVTGSATLQVAPDCADLTIVLTADAPRPGAATSAVEAKQATLVAALGKLGVRGPDVQLSTLQLDPVFDHTPDGLAQLTVRTYRATIEVIATTHQLDQVAALMDAGADAGAMSMQSAFRRSDLPALKKQVRDLALAAAREKAAQTAAGLDVQLGPIVSVSESQGGAIWSNTYFPHAQGAGPGAGIGAAMEPLSLDVTIAYELPRAAGSGAR